LRRPQIIQPIGIAGETAIGAPLIIVAQGWRWESGAAVEQKVELLRERTERLIEQVADLRPDLHGAERRLEASIAALGDRIEETRTEIVEREERKDRQAASVDARGLPVLALGIILSTIPDEMSKIPGGRGWIVFAALTAVSLAFTGHTWRRVTR